MRVHFVHPTKKDGAGAASADTCKSRGNRVFAALTAIFHTPEGNALRKGLVDAYGEHFVSEMPARSKGTSVFWEWLKVPSALGGGFRHIDLAIAHLADVKCK